MGLVQQHLLLFFEVEHRKPHYGERGEADVVHLVNPGLKDLLA